MEPIHEKYSDTVLLLVGGGKRKCGRRKCGKLKIGKNENS